MRRCLIGRAGLLLGSLAVAALTSGLEAREGLGPFRGQVVDLETGKPIAGAVVLAVWWEVIATPVQGKSRFHDAKEAVTGADGRFEMPGLSVSFWKLGVQPAQFTVFVPGYVWLATVVTPSDGQRFVAPTLVQMKRLKTQDELLQKSRGYPSRIPEGKMPELLKAINIERDMLGLPPEGRR